MATEGDARKTLMESIGTLLSAPRGAQALPRVVISGLMEYYVDVVKVTDVKEVLIEDVPDAVVDMYKRDADSVPPTILKAVTRWVLGRATLDKPHSEPAASPSVYTPSVKDTVAVVTEKEGGGEELLFGEAGADKRLTDQLEADKKAQGLSGMEIAQLCLGIELGRVLVLSDIAGKIHYGADPRMSEPAKAFRKAGVLTLQKIMDGNAVIREAGAHMQGLVREYSALGLVTQASLISTWWNETCIAAGSSDKLMVEYLKAYLRKYCGRGLPVPIDIVEVSRSQAVISEGGVSQELIKEAKDAARSAKAEVSSLKAEVGNLKAELNRVKQALANKQSGSPSNPNGQKGQGRDKNMTCLICGEKGHRAANCPFNTFKSKEEGESGKDEE